MKLLKNQPQPIPEPRLSYGADRIEPYRLLDQMDLHDLLVFEAGEPGTESTSIGQPPRIIKRASAYGKKTDKLFITAIRRNGQIEVWRAR